MIARRIGAACEAAHISALLAQPAPRAWIAACDMAGVSTQTFGPNVAEAASGQMLAGDGAAFAAVAALAVAWMPPAARADAASAAASMRGRMVRRINGTSLC